MNSKMFRMHAVVNDPIPIEGLSIQEIERSSRFTKNPVGMKFDRKKPIFVISTQRYYYMYQGREDAAQLLTAVDSHTTDEIVKIIKFFKISSIKVIDYTSEQFIKLEKCPGSLKYWQFFQWFLQRKRSALRTYLYSGVYAIAKHQEILSVGISSQSATSSLMRAIETETSCACSLYSGFLEQGRFLFSLISPLKPSYKQKVLIVSIDQEMNMGQWLFCSGRVYFWRFWTPSLKENINQQIVPAVQSLLRYMEKITNVQDLEIAFVAERKTESAVFSTSFPMSTFFQPEDILLLMERESIYASPKIRLFHNLVLSLRRRPYQIYNQGWQIAGKLFKRYAPQVLQALSALFLLTSSGLFYLCLGLREHNKVISKNLSMLSQELMRMRIEVESMPFSIRQAKMIQDILQSSGMQQERLWTFLESMTEVLGDSYLLEFLSLEEEKVRIGVHPIFPQQQAVFDVFFESWQRIFPSVQYQIVRSPEDCKATEATADKGKFGGAGEFSSLVIEARSPFQEQVK
ncbi:hypothetical protein [Candidatus Hydrogenosomobacter endosymbioticus]|uniref:Uncharacterized protein n=1 Tax=Candidatus Hydrogenosomobacter endosymbioticus TaxID=2558174 RepID=A0ABM7V9E5_9PROT|nr:hypothetical protein [Candidatus Hydrogenosomobacter endosymbioticus]BDB96412.1 hypothetical protein HYD_5450 [Candidatus Hydrogenosomobacter endosymbioticus]